jgi:hypothetical protein
MRIDGAILNCYPFSNMKKIHAVSSLLGTMKGFDKWKKMFVIEFFDYGIGYFDFEYGCKSIQDSHKDE